MNPPKSANSQRYRNKIEYKLYIYIPIYSYIYIYVCACVKYIPIFTFIIISLSRFPSLSLTIAIIFQANQHNHKEILDSERQSLYKMVGADPLKVPENCVLP